MARNLSAWGLDVGTTSLKAMKLQREGGTLSVAAFDVVEHDKFLTEPDVDKDEIIRHTLAKFLERHPIKGEPVFVGVPGSSTFARFVKLPPVEPKKIPEIVRFEAIQQIPFPLEQVNWDYQTFASPDSPDVEVGIFAMKKELVAQVMANYKLSNMVVEGVQMSPLAVFNAVLHDEMTGGKGTVVLDIGAEHTDLIFIDQGRLWLRTINIGGNNFTDALSKSFKVSFHKAEQLKRTAATSKYAKQIFQAMRPVFADLVAEVQRSVGFYNSGHRDARLERVIGMGNPFKLPNLQKYLAQNLQMEVVRLESFKKVKVEGKLAAGLNEHILGLAGVYGLALQGLDLANIDTNLLPMDIARQMVWRQKRPWFAAAAACVAVGVGVMGWSVMQQESAFSMGLSEEKVNANAAVLARGELLKKEFTGIPDTYERDRQDIQSLLNMSNERTIWPMVLHDIFATLPQVADPPKAKPSEPRVRSNEETIIIKQITAEYKINLSDYKAAAPTAPPAGGGGIPGEPNFSYDAAPPGSNTGGVSLGVTGPPGVPVGEIKDRGFYVEIRGYTPFNKPGRGNDLVFRYSMHLVRRAPKEGDARRPYYFESARNIDQLTISKPAGLNAVPTLKFITPWGANKGPFWDSFVPDMMGLQPPPEALGGAGVAGGGGIFAPGGGAVAALTPPALPDPDVLKGTMDGYKEFVIPLRVFLKPTPNDPQKSEPKK